MRTLSIDAGQGEKVVIYSGEGRIVLQVRRLIHGADDPTAPSFKSGVTLTPTQAARVAAELLTVAGKLVADANDDGS